MCHQNGTSGCQLYDAKPVRADSGSLTLDLFTLASPILFKVMQGRSLRGARGAAAPPPGNYSKKTISVDFPGNLRVATKS